MPIYAFDVETYKKEKDGFYYPILDATGEFFICGSLVSETGRKYFFSNKKEMWDKIIEIGKKDAKRGKTAYFYGHNMKYDFYNIANLEDSNLLWLSERPFICNYMDTQKRVFSREEFEKWRKWAEKSNVKFSFNYAKEEVIVKQRKQIIKFLDSVAIFKTSLKKIGELINHKKLEMPERLNDISPGELMKISDYVTRDSEIVVKAMQMLKEKLKEEDVYIKRLCTMNQIAIGYLISRLRQTEGNEGILNYNDEGKPTELTIKTRYADEIHEAYRSGRVEAWKTGFINSVTAIDKNSLYPYALMKMDMPDLRTERKIKNPLNIYEMKTLLGKIGISRALVKNVSNKLGLLMVRTNSRTYIPREGKYMIGTWTHWELKKALEDGYEILDIEWSVIYDKGPNPFKEIVGKIYERRMNANTEFEKNFYKSIMNCGIGKLAQRKKQMEIFIDSVEMVEKYLKLNYDIIKGIDNTTDLMFAREMKGKVKRYYTPIIPCLVNAYSRLVMYDEFKKVPLQDLVYTDTDSVVFMGDHLNNFSLGPDIGKFKIEQDRATGTKLINKEAIIWGIKAKSIGETIAISGVPKKNICIEDFRKGQVEVVKMIGFKQRIGKAGRFTKEQRDLKVQLEDHLKQEKLLAQPLVYIDHGITNINKFKPLLDKIPCETEF